MTPQFKTGTKIPLLTPTGVPAVNSDCCCGSGCSPCLSSNACVSCPTDTPTQWHLTISGATTCSCIGFNNCNPNCTNSYKGVGSPNGTYILSQVPGSPCVYSVTTTNIQVYEYGNGTCTGTPTTIYDFKFILTINATTVSFTAMDSNTGLSYAAIDIANTSDTKTDCCSSYTFASSGGACRPYFASVGSTAVLTPC